MKKLLILFTIFILQYSILNSQPGWVQTYQPFYNPDGDNDYYVEDIRLCPNGGFAVTGYYSYFDDWEQYKWGYLMKTDSDGNYLWAKKDTVSFYSETESTAFVVLDNGSFICVGKNAWIGGGHYIIKRDSNGNRQWVIQSDPDYSIEAMELTDDGYLITTGSSMDDTINLQKFDLNGSLIWREAYLPDGFDFGGGYSVIQTLDGGYAITGSVYGTNNRDILVVKTDENGDSLWTYTYDGYGYNDQGNCIIENNNEGFIIVGEIHGPINRSIDTFILNINTNGDTLWMEIIPDLACSYSVVKTQDNNFVGYCWSGSSTNKTRLYKFNEAGYILWNEQLPHWPAEGDRCFQELDNGGFVCGGSAQWGDSIFLTKTNSDGIYTAIDDYVNPKNTINICSYPNPFNSMMAISFNLLKPTDIEIKVFNIKGQMIETLLHKQKKNGENSIVWNANEYSSGVYFIQLYTDDKLEKVKKVLLIK